MPGRVTPPPPRSKFHRVTSALAFACAVVLCLVVSVMVISPRLLSSPAVTVWVNARAYDQVAQQVETGVILRDAPSGSLVPLPAGFQRLSPAKNGQVLVYRDRATVRLLFYPAQSGFMTWVYLYASDDKPIDLGGECAGLEHQRAHWFLFHCP